MVIIGKFNRTGPDSEPPRAIFSSPLKSAAPCLPAYLLTSSDIKSSALCFSAAPGAEDSLSEA